MDDRSAGCYRLDLIADGWQRLPFDIDKFRRIFGLGARFGSHEDHRLALPHRAIGNKQILRRSPMARPVQRDADEGLTPRIDLGGSKNGDDARRRSRAG
jgi:hypothetical protein